MISMYLSVFSYNNYAIMNIDFSNEETKDRKGKMI